MRNRFTGVIALIAVLALAGTACGKKSTPKENATGTPSATATGIALTTLLPGVLQVGSCLDYQPFEYYEGGQLKGFDVEIMEAVAKRLGLRVVWKKANFDTIFTALAAGQFDAVAAASTIKPDRQQVIDFTIPYYNSRQSLTVNTQKTRGIKTTDDLTKGNIIGVQKGTTGKDWAEANLAPNGILIKTYTEAPDAFTDLEAGQITGVINDETSSEAEAAKRPGLSVVEGIDTGEHYGIAVSKDHSDVLTAINSAMEQIIADGTYRKIFEKYFPGVTIPIEYGG
jgi:ABC-type amino acid transport substrate-binding protein